MYQQIIAGAVGTALGVGGSLLAAGKKPKVPDWNDVKLGDAAKEAAKINKNSLPDYMEIGSKVNTFNAQEIERMLRISNPEFAGIESKYLSSLGSQLRGELPKDVEDLIKRKTAESAVSGGFTGSGVHRNLSARDIGLTSLQLTQNAMDSASTWMARARDQANRNVYDVTSMFVSPQQQFQANWMNAENRFNRDLMANKISAAPDPKRAAIGQWMQTTGSQLIGMSMGGGMGGMGGGMGGGGASAPSSAPPSSYVAPQASPNYNFSLY
jgi:hypothetical protein